ncbi:MAG TPA: hypothetical protein VI006_17865 [Solirubrobacteraceae bacterium]
MSETIVLIHGLWMTALSWENPDRCHYTGGQDGWEEVADHALEWAVTQAAKLAVPR